MKKNFSVIPSVRDIKALNRALAIPGDTILLSTITHIGNLRELVLLCHKAGKRVIVNHELVGGLGNDNMAFEMLKKMYKVDAVIESNQIYAGRAKAAGIEVILKIPLIDSLARESALRMINNVKPDTLEVKPAICALDNITKIQKGYAGKIFASGFIDDTAFADKLYNSGLDGIMTSRQELWDRFY
ncbi:glycerol-3-phosphate responsive antiterminator [Pectinatus haikarae]|nr:glycerol-3-phosphate responsive antiterminator [Pectinatus haikarae]